MSSAPETTPPNSRFPWAALVPELVVRNATRSIAFYRDLLGFTVNYARDDPPFAYLSLSAAQLMLEQLNPTTRMVGTLEPPFGRGINLQIECNDVNIIVLRLESAGVPLYHPVVDSWYDVDDVQFGARQLLVQDPDGYLLRFAQDLGVRQRPEGGR